MSPGVGRFNYCITESTKVDVPAGRHDAWLVRLEISLVALGLAAVEL